MHTSIDISMHLRVYAHISSNIIHTIIRMYYTFFNFAKEITLDSITFRSVCVERETLVLFRKDSSPNPSHSNITLRHSNTRSTTLKLIYIILNNKLKNHVF